MTLATLPLDGPSSYAPGRQPAGLSGTLRQPEQLTILHRLALLDTPAEQAFDRLTRLAAKILHAPVALLSLVDGDRSFFKSSVGLPEPWASRREMPLSDSVCQHVVAANAPLVINDARAHPLVSDNQAVAELRIMAYLGIPLVTSEGQALGTFAVIDTVPREWASDDVTTLGDLAASALTEIERRAETNQRLLAEQRLHLLESVVGNTTAAVVIAEADPAEPSDPRIVFVNDAYTRLTGYAPDEVVGRTHQVLNKAETDRSQIDTIRTALATWKPARLELLSHRKDGSAFWAEWNIVPIADRVGRYSHWVLIQRDVSEQKAAAAALRESEARRQAILESSLDCIITLDNQERVIEFNPAAERTFGYSRAAVMGKPLVELIVAPLQGGSQCLGLDQYLATEKNSLLEKRLEMTAVRADGTTFPAELAFTTIRVEGPVFTAFLRDVSQRKRAERSLAAHHTCTRIIADTAVMDETIPKILQAVCENIGWCLGQMWQLDPKAGLLRCAAAWHEPAAAVAAFADLSRKTTFRPGVGLPGRVWASREPNWVSNVESGAHFSRAEAATRCGLHGAFAFPILHGEEVLGVMEFFHDHILEPDGPLRAMLAAVGSQVGQFIERMRTDEALRRSEAEMRRLALIAQRTDNAVILTDPQGRIEWVNDGFTRICEYQLEEVLGKTPGSVLQGPETDAATVAHMRERLLQGQGFQVEILNYAKSGRTFWLAIEVQPIRDDQGTLTRFMAMESDVTARKQVEAELREAKEAAEAANRAKSEFFSRMSHELRTPLNVILGFAQLLELDALSDPQRESAEQIVKGGRHLLALINDVLDVARIEAGGTGVISLEEVDVGAVVGEVLGMIQPLAEQARLRLLPPQPGTCDRAVRADLQRLKQVLLNLLSNAIKYNRQGGSVAVSCAEAAGAMLRISVTDTGPGIPPEKMHRLFVPFDRLDAEQTGEEGTGLGLTLSRGLVEAMQGTMGVESSPGRGSTFWVELPLISPGLPMADCGLQNSEQSAIGHRPSAINGTVLYIEDNPANFRLVERILKFRPGVRLLSAMQGRLGIDLAREHRPDVIFLDLHLPDLPGDEVLRRLRDDAATRDIPVIVLSADATPHQVERLLAAGASRYLIKPLDVKEFLQILDETLHDGER